MLICNKGELLGTVKAPDHRLGHVTSVLQRPAFF
jgi:hypothetical protein